jgi:hypothetical protein
MPTEDEKKKKPSGFDLNATPESFANLGASPRMPESVSPAMPSGINLSEPTRQAAQDLEAARNDPEMRAAAMEQQRTATAANKEALRSQKFKNENAGQRNEISLRAIEAREAAQAKREAGAAAEAQRKADFWNQGKANERPEVKAAREARTADFNQRQDAQRQRMDDRLKPIREAAFARQDAESKRQDDMKDPAKRLAAMRMRAAELGATINYAEVSGEDGKKATYTANTPEGKKAQSDTMAVRQNREAARKAAIAKADRDKKNQSDMATFRSLASMPTPAVPAQPSTEAVNPQRPVQPAKQAAAPVTPGMEAARAGLPLWQRKSPQANPAPQPQAASPAAGPVMRMMSSKTPWADAANAIGSSAASVGQGVQAGASMVGNLLTGQYGFAGKTIMPRRRTQSAAITSSPLLSKK